MFHLDKVIVSEEIINKEFVCNLSACKGACCVDGEAGAPLEESETKKLEEIYPLIKKYLGKESIDIIEKEGVFVARENGDLETPLIEGADCVYVVKNEQGIAKCAIEEAYQKGVIDWKKPISCHLYPIRVDQYSSFEAVNYHRWEICDDACLLGKEVEVPIYKFVKEALVRKFGNEWYSKLEKIASEFKKSEP